MLSDNVCRERLELRQKLIDAQIDKLAKIKAKEDAILNKHIKEAEIKAEEVERIKREKREELLVDMHCSWLLMV